MASQFAWRRRPLFFTRETFRRLATLVKSASLALAAVSIWGCSHDSPQPPLRSSHGNPVALGAGASIAVALPGEKEAVKEAKEKSPVSASVPAPVPAPVSANDATKSEVERGVKDVAAEGGGSATSPVENQAEDKKTAVKRKASAEKKSAEADPSSFQPPYPQRENPFERPDFNKMTPAKRASEASGRKIALRGFIDVGGLKAVLEVDGQSAILSAGQSRGDLHVVEISPPNVVLQRGRIRWSETLFSAK